MIRVVEIEVAFGEFAKKTHLCTLQWQEMFLLLPMQRIR